MIDVLILYILYSGVGLLIYSKLSSVSFKENKAKAIGESFMLGVFLVVFASNIVQLLKFNLAPLFFLIPMFVIAVIAYLINFKTLNYAKQDLSRLRNISYLEYFAWLIVIVHLYLIISQNNLLPLTPWDAWYGWIAKAKVWVFNGLSEPLLTRADWLVRDGGFTNPTAHYPDGLPLLYYINSGLFGWSESSLNAIYPALLISLLLMMYGNINFLTGNIKIAWIAVLMIVTLPFVNIHISLAGYADIWVASYLFILIITAQRYVDFRKPQNIITLIIYSSGLIMFKLESWVWLVGVYLVLAFALMTKKTRVIALLSLIVLFLIWMLLGGFEFQSPLGEITIQPDLIQIPMLGTYELSFTNTSEAWLESLFLSHNWSLLWFSLPFVIYLTLMLKDKASIILPAAYLIYASMFLFVLFYMTGASVWANDFTSSNRIVLHIVPVYIYFVIRVFEQWQLQKKPS